MTVCRRVLLIAGSDNSGGAGLEAGQKVLAAHGCYAMMATTALTVQNTTGVKDMHVIPASFVERQIEACLEDLGADVVTTGMLATADTIEATVRQLVKHKVATLVVDLVMFSRRQAPDFSLTEPCRALVQNLLPLTTVLTPNIPEAKLLLEEGYRLGLAVSHDGVINSVVDVETLGRRIQALGPKWVLVKGVHLPFRVDLTVAHTEAERKFVVDVLVGPDDFIIRFQSPWQQSTSTHGTGCSLAAAISSGLAKGQCVSTAVRASCRYVEAVIRMAPDIGSGNGPLGYFYSTYSLPFCPGYFIEYMLDHPAVKDTWKSFIYHPFVVSLGDGTLPLESFKGYIIQDYIFLTYFLQAHALATYKAKNAEDIHRSSEIVSQIQRKRQLHIQYCTSFGISEAEIQATEEKQACTAHTRYVLDVGHSDDWLALQMALAPCLLGYGAVAEMLLADPHTHRDGNMYWPWIQSYVANDYTHAVRLGSQLLEDGMQRQSPSRVEELIKIFVHGLKLYVCNQMKTGFWNMFPYQ